MTMHIAPELTHKLNERQCAGEHNDEPQRNEYEYYASITKAPPTLNVCVELIEAETQMIDKGSPRMPYKFY